MQNLINTNLDNKTNLRKIIYIAIHCSAGPQNQSVESILDFWRNVRGWKSPGYHYIIKSDGEIVDLFPIEEISNGVQGYNSKTVNMCYIGGVDHRNKPIDNRTLGQKESMLKIVSELKEKFPYAKIQGHRDFPGVAKACPSFDVECWLKENNLT